MKISVALAAYKGEQYIEQQVASVLEQLNADDELIISDDMPETGLSELLGKRFGNDSRIKYYEGPGKGVVKNFENAVSKTTGDIIFLCDQDDVWLPGKVSHCIKAIGKGADLVLHDAKVTDKNLRVKQNSYFEMHESKPGYFCNIKKNSFMGCCMAFKSELKKDILPFPDNIPMHDQWIGLVAEKKYKVRFIYEPLILHRIHGDNVTGGKTSIFKKIKWRTALVKDLIGV